MRNTLRYGLLGALLFGVPSCYVHTKETVVEQKPVTAGTCTNSVWIEGHYDNAGAWIPGTWKCTRVTK